MNSNVPTSLLYNLAKSVGQLQELWIADAAWVWVLPGPAVSVFSVVPIPRSHSVRLLVPPG